MSARLAILVAVMIFGAGLCVHASAATTASFTASAAAPPLATLRKQAATGDAAAEYALGHRLVSSKTPAGESEGLTWYRRAAAQGNSAAEWALGLLYAFGDPPIGIRQDVPTGLKWMRKSLSDGSADHMSTYGYILAVSGFHAGHKQDMQDGVAWIRRGAKSGSAQGMSVLGTLLWTGWMGVTRNKSGAEHWLLESAKLGNAKAQESLGALYVTGGFGNPDVTAGLHWLRESAKQGDVTAEGMLGMLLITGKIHVPRNPVEGVQWANKAIAKQDPAGYYALGFAYQDGSGEPVDPAKAWYNFAAALHLDPQHKQVKVDEARLRMSQVAARLSAMQLGALRAEVAKIPVPKSRQSSAIQQ